MRATDILMQEHRIIERVLASLETAVHRLERGEEVRAGFFIDAADFATGFTDGSHHRKEEDGLFPAMVAGGLPSDTGPIGVMLEEHEEGRAYARAIRDGAERLTSRDEDARIQVILNARGYIALLRQHIDKEDNILFPMAEHVIPLSEQDDLTARFIDLELEGSVPGEQQRYLALADTLQKELQR